MSRRCRGGLDSRSGSGALGPIPGGSPCGCIKRSSIKPESQGCVEPLVYGENILLDPGFETYASVIGLDTGPDGETFPEMNIGPPNGLFWANGDVYEGELPPWTVFTNMGVGNDDDRWFISTAGPDSGTYHARINIDGAGAGEARLIPVGLRGCTLIYPELDTDTFWETRNQYVPWTARVEQGDTFSISVRTKSDRLITNPFLEIVIQIYASQEFGSPNLFDSDLWPFSFISGAYTTYGGGPFTVPTGGKYMLVQFDFGQANAEAGITTIDVDNAVLELNAA